MVHADVRPARLAADLVAQLERTLRLLGTRIYVPSMSELRSMTGGIDRASVPLLAVLEDRGPVRPSDLAAALELDPSTVSRQIVHLERLGLAERSADETDGRVSRISLTPHGIRNLALVRDSRAVLLQAVFADWSESDQRQLNTLLERLSAGLATLPATRSKAGP